MKLFLSLWICTALLFLVSCDRLEDLELQDRPSQWAIPLFTAETSFEDLFAEAPEATSVFVTEAGLMALRFSADPTRRYADQVIDPIDLNIPILLIENPQEFEIPLDGDIEIERAILSGENLNFGYQSSTAQDVFLTISIPEFSKDGEPMIFYDTLIYEGTLPVQGGIFDFDLKDWEMSFPEGTITIEYTSRNAANEDVELDNIAFLIEKRIDFQYIEGIINNYRFEYGRDTIEISLYEDFLGGDLVLEDPRIIANFGNSFGVPVRGELVDFGVVTVNDDFVPIESPLVEEGFIFPFPGFDEDESDVKRTTVILDRNNSNVVEAFNSQPLRVEYSLTLNINPDNVSNLRGWIADSSLLEIQVDVEIPIQGRADDFEVESFYDVSFDADENVSAATIRLVNENTIPLGISSQIYTLSGGQVTDSLWDQITEIVSAAPVDEQGFSSGSQTSAVDIPLEGETLDRFLSSDALLVRSQFSSTLGQSIQVTPADRLQTSAGVFITLTPQ